MVQNKINFEVDVDGVKVKLSVVKPNVRQREAAQIEYSRSFAKLLTAGVMPESELENELRKHNLWDDAKQKQLNEINERITQNEKVVGKDGKSMVKGTTKAQARQAAIQLRRDRALKQRLTADRIQMQSNTVEGQAENARFAYLVSQCTLNATTGEPYFESYDEYLVKDDDPVVLKAADEFAKLYYGIDPNFEKNLPENQFLVRFKYADADSLRLINDKGQLCDAEGRLVREDGRFIDEKGNLIDRDGNLVDEAGDQIVETFDFEDEGPTAEEKVSETLVIKDEASQDAQLMFTQGSEATPSE